MDGLHKPMLQTPYLTIKIKPDLSQVLPLSAVLKVLCDLH